MTIQQPIKTKPKRPILTLGTFKKGNPQTAPAMAQPMEPKPTTTKTDVAEVIMAKWPDIFDKRNPQPLAIGIHKDIAEALQVSENGVKAFLGKWTRGMRYLKALSKAENKRLNHITGAVQDITEQDRSRAEVLFKQRCERREQNKRART